MTFAAYGLVVHAGNRDAQLGARAYLILALFGEAMILAGLLWAAGSAEALTLGGLREGIAAAERGSWMATLLWLGFGVKAGVVGLHVWLPLAHPVAPTPASAVLSGVMIKAGLLGWLGTLPLGDPAAGLESLGRVAIVLGLAGAFVAALFGVTQRHPKAVLAYSSVSQMGMLTAALGAGLAAPALWPALSAALVLFAAHHGMTKGALFLGVGISEHPPRLPAWLLWALLALPALSLTGALASGLSTKWTLKAALYDGGLSTLVLWLSLAAVGTTALMARALWRQWRERGEAEGATWAPMPVTWLASVALAATVPLWLPMAGPGPHWPPAEELVGLLWPVGLGLVLAVAVWQLARALPWRISRRLLPGDFWWLYASLAQQLVGALDGAGRALEGWASRRRERLVEAERRLLKGLAELSRYERGFRRLAVPLMVGVALLLLVGFWLG